MTPASNYETVREEREGELTEAPRNLRISLPRKKPGTHSTRNPVQMQQGSSIGLSEPQQLQHQQGCQLPRGHHEVELGDAVGGFA